MKTQRLKQLKKVTNRRWSSKNCIFKEANFVTNVDLRITNTSKNNLIFVSTLANSSNCRSCSVFRVLSMWNTFWGLGFVACLKRHRSSTDIYSPTWGVFCHSFQNPIWRNQCFRNPRLYRKNITFSSNRTSPHVSRLTTLGPSFRILTNEL